MVFREVVDMGETARGVRADEADLVVVGAGVAGLTAALGAAEAGLRVVLVHKGAPWRADDHDQPTATFYAQGGVAVVTPEGRHSADSDSVDLHVADTLAAGAGLTDPTVAASILADGWSAVRALIARGAEFDRTPQGALSRTREGGHSVRRILHIGGDATGAGIARVLGSAFTQACNEGRIDCRAKTLVTAVCADELGRVTGVRCLADGVESVVTAPTVLLATGGAGHLYSATTNPVGATADGIALALRAGAHVADLEFIQFHPTMLYTPGVRGRRTLITEALRGEGARLVDARGRSVTSGVHPMGDLAPRDVVANAVIDSMDRTGEPCVYLDVSAVADFARRFPTVSAGLRAAGIEIGAPIPVVPGAHYQCGGVVTDTMSRTTVPGLLAAGEVARTGLHGGNRLASNSLLEGLVMGMRAAVVAGLGRADERGSTVGFDRLEYAAIDRDVLQDAMTRHAGLRRDASGLAEVATLLAAAPVIGAPTLRTVEDASLSMAAQAVVAAATARTQSRGSHVRTDDSGATDDQSRVFGLVEGRVVQLASASATVGLG